MALVTMPMACHSACINTPARACCAHDWPCLRPRPRAAVPNVGSEANATTAAAGAMAAQRRNTTVRAQLDPRRTGGLFTAGSVAIDPMAAAALSSGSSGSVAKNVAGAYAWAWLGAYLAMVLSGKGQHTLQDHEGCAHGAGGGGEGRRRMVGCTACLSLPLPGAPRPCRAAPPSAALALSETSPPHLHPSCTNTTAPLQSWAPRRQALVPRGRTWPWAMRPLQGKGTLRPARSWAASASLVGGWVVECQDQWMQGKKTFTAALLLHSCTSACCN